MINILNLYAGVGGNRKLWKNCRVVAVESNKKIAAVYKRLHINDEVIIGDAHEYLRRHFNNFDFIWSSPPCQTHSRMVKFTRHKNHKFPNMEIYEEILFLQYFFKGKFVVENVVPFYKPLIQPTQTIGRHCFWSNFNFNIDDIVRPKSFINMTNLAGKNALMDWLGIYYKENIYYEGNHCPAQVLRNCVHPDIGEQILNAARK